MVKKIVELILLLIFTTTVLIFSSSCCGDNPQVCFTLSQEACPEADLANLVFHASEIKEDWVYMSTTTGETQSYQDSEHLFGKYQKKSGIKHSANAVVNNNTIESRFVEGYEINYGFWSQDSYRKYNYREIYRKKHGRYPTPLELANMTCEDAKKWFKDIHTVHRTILSDDPPRDVKCIEQPYSKYCITMTYDKSTINGEIEFPNGGRCKVKRIIKERSKVDPCENPNNVNLQFDGNCSHCQ